MLLSAIFKICKLPRSQTYVGKMLAADQRSAASLSTVKNEESNGNKQVNSILKFFLKPTFTNMYITNFDNIKIYFWRKNIEKVTYFAYLLFLDQNQICYWSCEV